MCVMASLIIGAVPMAASHVRSLSPNNLSFSSPNNLSFSGSQTLADLNLASCKSSTSISSPILPSIYCGRGDRKTAKGKRFSHSFGNARPRNKKMGRGPPRISVPPSPPKKNRFEDGEKIKIEIDESLFTS